MIVNVARPCDAEVTLFLSVEEAAVIEQALYIVDQGEATEFQEAAGALGLELEDAMEEHHLPKFPAETR